MLRSESFDLFPPERGFVASATAPTTGLRKTALNATHRQMGARMVPFGGWEMPVEYSGIVAEHMAVRTRAGLFDVSHMGRLEVEGAGALALLQKVSSNDVSRLRKGQAQYSALLNDRGGIVDDLLVHKVEEERYLLCINASRREADLDWIRKHNETGATVRDISQQTSQLALQGPRSLAILQPLVDTDLGAVRYYWFVRGTVADTPCWIARTGYTGEDGFEIYLPAGESERLWHKLLEAGRSEGLLPCGLGARNTLRLEAGMLLYGNDMNEQTTPLEVGLGWITKLDKGEFLGREVLAQQKQTGVSRKLAGFCMVDRAIARDGAPVFSQNQEVGRVTSGSYAPYLKKNIGLAWLPAELAQPGKRIEIRIRGALAAAEIVPTPFYRRPT
ncbi:MAG TPA: glycine cleavage system aminomethyltransferase GcvT [Terriglobia bacterium]|nr:glycine cleavage system aminomethyltransferase GcvT [Terriglobia bacterium]